MVVPMSVELSIFQAPSVKCVPPTNFGLKVAASSYGRAREAGGAGIARWNGTHPRHARTKALPSSRRSSVQRAASTRKGVTELDVYTVAVND